MPSYPWTDTQTTLTKCEDWSGADWREGEEQLGSKSQPGKGRDSKGEEEGAESRTCSGCHGWIWGEKRSRVHECGEMELHPALDPEKRGIEK